MMFQRFGAAVAEIVLPALNILLGMMPYVKIGVFCTKSKLVSERAPISCRIYLSTIKLKADSI